MLLVCATAGVATVLVVLVLVLTVLGEAAERDAPRWTHRPSSHRGAAAEQEPGGEAADAGSPPAET